MAKPEAVVAWSGRVHDATRGLLERPLVQNSKEFGARLRSTWSGGGVEPVQRVMEPRRRDGQEGRDLRELPRAEVLGIDTQPA